MSKGKNGKEVKKPKRVFVPNAPGIPANLVPLASVALKPKRK